MVAHIEQPLADREPQPHAAGRMSVGAGLDLDAAHVGVSADRDQLDRDVVGQPRRHWLGGIDRRRSDPLAQAQRARMVLVPVAQEDGVDPADRVELRQPAGLGALAAIDEETTPVRLDQKGGQSFGPRPDTTLRRAFMSRSMASSMARRFTDRGRPARAATYSHAATWCGGPVFARLNFNAIWQSLNSRVRGNERVWQFSPPLSANHPVQAPRSPPSPGRRRPRRTACRTAASRRRRWRRPCAADAPWWDRRSRDRTGRPGSCR